MTTDSDGLGIFTPHVILGLRGKAGDDPLVPNTQATYPGGRRTALPQSVRSRLHDHTTSSPPHQITAARDAKLALIDLIDKKFRD